MISEKKFKFVSHFYTYCINKSLSTLAIFLFCFLIVFYYIIMINIEFVAFIIIRKII